MSFSIDGADNLLKIEAHLKEHQYLSGADRPNQNDAHVYKQLKDKKMIPEQAKYPNMFAWFGWINMFNPAVIEKWAPAAKKEESKVESKPESKPAEKKAAAGAEEDVDLFGSEDDEAEKEKEALRKKIADEHNAKKLAKGKVECPKTIFIFDVKVYELEQNLDQLATKIRSEIVMDGLVWSKDHQLVEVAYGMKKL